MLPQQQYEMENYQQQQSQMPGGALPSGMPNPQMFTSNANAPPYSSAQQQQHQPQGVGVDIHNHYCFNSHIATFMSH
jgi:hypothetical protein